MNRTLTAVVVMPRSLPRTWTRKTCTEILHTWLCLVGNSIHNYISRNKSSKMTRAVRPARDSDQSGCTFTQSDQSWLFIWRGFGPLLSRALNAQYDPSLCWAHTGSSFLYPATQKVVGYYLVPAETFTDDQIRVFDDKWTIILISSP